MALHSFPMSVSLNPLIHSVFYEDDYSLDTPIPPSSHFIITETGDDITSETGDKLITE